MTVANLNCRVRQGVANFDMTFYMKVNIPCCVAFRKAWLWGTDAFVRASDVFFHNLAKFQNLYIPRAEKKKSHNEVLIIHCFKVLDVPVICRILGGGEDRNVAAVNGKQLRQALLA